ncbi:hypothetical protein CFC21_099929 [Triticum aestivum]|uniref:F-box domain-containing protein n=2 Tax=Triticum aestivum TaxID=4565 RepID=A0A9R1M061_WHEAT|nr:hypothetical protein CFC21_099929 [Triticum aestivum]
MGRFTFVRGPSPSSTEPPPSPSSGMSNPVARSPTREEGCRAPTTRARSSSSTDSGMALERLTDELLVEILPRVPASSDNSCNLVSERWLGLIDHPDHRKRLLQPLAGFFYNSTGKHSFKNRTDDRTGEAAGSDFHLSDRWFFRFNVMMNVMWLYMFG